MKVANNHQVFTMAKHFSPLSLFLITFLIASTLLTSARDILPRDISLVREPNENYYILRKSPVDIICQAKNAAEIIFSCMGTQIPPSSVELTDVSDTDPELTEAKIEVSRADLQSNGSLWCECSAVDIDGQVAITSRRSYISIAHLKSKFETQPKSAASFVGDEVEFECGAPEGEPKAEIVWRKDKKRLEIENNPRFVVTEKGSLIIQFVVPEDRGYYQCVARNVAGRRESEEALLSVTALAESAEPDLEINGGVNAGKKSAGGAKLRATRQSNKTFFTTEPQEKYFITREKPLTIDCGVVGADVLTFRCNGKRMSRDRQKINQGLDATNKRVIQSQIEVTYDEVQAFMTEAYGGAQTYQCICVAWYQDPGASNGWGMLDSLPTHGYVYLSYLDKTFQAEPVDVTVGLNTDATFACEPPNGQPNPWIYWYKDDIRLDPRSSEKYSINDRGHLTVHNVQYEDAGGYNCQAENSVDSLKSRTGTLTVTAEAVITTSAAPSEDDLPAFPDIIPTSPVFLQDLEADNVLGPDGTKTIACAVVSADHITITCDGTRLRADEYQLQHKTHIESGKRLFHVKTVITAERIANKTNYNCQCVAWNFNEQKQWQQTEGTKGYFQKPGPGFIMDEFKVAPVDTDAYYESQTQLYCEPPEGNPPPQIYWIKDGVRIDTEADKNFVQNVEGLIIELVRESNEGEYICVAENTEGRRESQPIRLTVLDKPTPTTEVTSTVVVDTETEMETTTFIEEDSSESEHEESLIYQQLDAEYYIVDDEAVTLECAVFTIKALVFVCNNETLLETQSTGFSVTLPDTMDTIRSNQLIITKEMFDKYKGTEPYTCFCRTVIMKDGQFTSLDSLPATIHVAYMEEEFLVQPMDTEVINMGRLELQCQAPQAFPEAQISWLKDGQDVIQDDRTKIEDSGTLVIENFREDDEGSYRCVANNSFDVRTSNEAFVSFSVTSAPGEQVTQYYTIQGVETDEPESEPETTSSELGILPSQTRYVSKELHSVYYWLKNKPLTITCEIYNVDSITFVCGDKNVEIEETKRLQDDNLVPTVEARITVPREDYDKVQNGSDYYCQCFGHYSVPGIVEDQKIASVRGFVESAFLRKNFQKQPENQTIMQGESLSLHCDPPEGKPTPKVSLTKDGEKIDDGERFQKINSPAGVMYMILEVELDDEGEYMCIAENVAGKRMSPAVYVEVKVKDDITPVTKVTTDSNGCVEMLMSCSDIAPRGKKDIRYCLAVQSYAACVYNYFKKCAAATSQVSVNAVRAAQLDAQKECMLKCDKLEECSTITSNSPDLSMGRTSLSIQNICSQRSSLVGCVDENLAGCNVTLSPPGVNARGSLVDVDAWFTEFCSIVRDNEKDLKSCPDVDKCGLHIEYAAHDNSTYWCYHISSLLMCTIHATTVPCNLHNVERRLLQLRTQADEQCAGHKTIFEPQPEVNPSTDESSSSEADPEPTATEEATDGGDGENVDQGSNENMEGGAEGKDTVDDTHDDDRDFGNNQDNDREDFESMEEITTMREKSDDKFNKHVDVYEETESNSDEYFNEKYDNNNPNMKEKDPYDEKGKTSQPGKNSDDDDYVYKDEIHETFTENVEDSVNHEKDDDEEQGDSRASIVEASKEDPGNGSPVLRTSMFLATFLQLLILASLSWR